MSDDELSRSLANFSLDHDSDSSGEIENTRIRNIRNINIMALDLQKLAQLSALIPKFNGEENQLGSFIRGVDTLIKHCGVPTPNADQWEIILCTVYQKLEGPAQDLINSRPELITWPPIRKLLTENFADHKSLAIWQQEITMLNIKSNETIPDFCNRILAMRAKIVQKIQFTFTEEPVRIAQMETFSMFLLSKFKSCLPYQYHIIIESQHHRLTTLDLTIQEVLRIHSVNAFNNQFKPRALPPKPVQNRNYPQNINRQQQGPSNYPNIPRNPFLPIPQDYPPRANPVPPPPNRANKPVVPPPRQNFQKQDYPRQNDPNKMSTTTRLSNQTQYQNYQRPRTQPGYLNYVETEIETADNGWEYHVNTSDTDNEQVYDYAEAQNYDTACPQDFYQEASENKHSN